MILFAKEANGGDVTGVLCLFGIFTNASSSLVPLLTLKGRESWSLVTPENESFSYTKKIMRHPNMWKRKFNFFICFSFAFMLGRTGMAAHRWKGSDATFWSLQGTKMPTSCQIFSIHEEWSLTKTFRVFSSFWSWIWDFLGICLLSCLSFLTARIQQSNTQAGFQDFYV